MTLADVTPSLLDAVPEFRPSVDEHIKTYGEVLHHVLFGDLTRFVLAARGRGEDALVKRTVAWLDTALREGDKDVRNLVAVSFVENVGPWSETARTFVESWPHALRVEADRQHRWSSGSA